MTAPRDELAQLLDLAAPPQASSVKLNAKAAELLVAVDGIGRIQLPVSAEQAGALRSLGRPAQHGRGERTLTDPTVRDTWEIPKELVDIQWSGALERALLAMRSALGLPADSRLVADFHSMLLYEPGQFFLPHKDSEKDDAMIATLVVILPSAHSGGALVVHRGDQTTTYHGSKSALSLIAFYSDCLHEVRPVTSGHRITLTYNLLLAGPSMSPAAGDGTTVAAVGRLLQEHFAAPRVRPYSTIREDPPNLLVYLLDHEYTARGLSWSRLKGADARRAQVLSAAAQRNGCDVLLALAEVQETWEAWESDPRDDWRWDDDGDEEEEIDVEGSEEYELHGLIEDSFRLTRWSDPAAGWAEDISLAVDGTEVCATTPTVRMDPYESHYEGYMGNYGNTLDRWYRRAAVVVWPREQAFPNRAQASPDWALGQLLALTAADEAARARTAVADLAPFWPAAVRIADQTALLASALKVATTLDDPWSARTLLQPFAVEALRPAHMTALAELAERYGQPWTDDLVEAWYEVPRAGPYVVGQDRSQWLGSLPRLCEGLQPCGVSGTSVARRLSELAWDGLASVIHDAARSARPTTRRERLSHAGEPLAAVLAAAELIEADLLRDRIVAFCGQMDRDLTTCLLAALRAAATFDPSWRRGRGFTDLTADVETRLQAQLAQPARPDDDWSIDLPDGCRCDLCETLADFLRDRARRGFDWPLAQKRRQHVHSRLDAAELPVKHQTRRTGRPFTLVLTKTPQLFEADRQERAKAQEDLAWLHEYGHRP